MVGEKTQLILPKTNLVEDWLINSMYQIWHLVQWWTGGTWEWPGPYNRKRSDWIIWIDQKLRSCRFCYQWPQLYNRSKSNHCSFLVNCFKGIINKNKKIILDHHLLKTELTLFCQCEYSFQNNLLIVWRQLLTRSYLHWQFTVWWLCCNILLHWRTVCHNTWYWIWQWQPFDGVGVNADIVVC